MRVFVKRVFRVFAVVGLLSVCGTLADAAPTTGYGWTVLKDGASFYWDFNEPGSGDAAADQVRGQANDALLSYQGAGRTPGYTANLGQAAALGGGSAFAADAMQEGILPGPWAVEFWMNANDGGYSYIVNLGTPDNSPAIYKMNNTVIPFSLAGQPAEGERPAFTPGEWQHVVVGYYGDGSAGVADRMDVAINGVVSTIDAGSFGVAMNAQRVVVGAAFSNGLDAFSGKIDEVALYDLSGMSEADIASKMSVLAAHFAAASEAPDTLLSLVDPAEISYTYTDPPFGQDGSHPFGDGGLTKLTDGQFMQASPADLAVSAVFGQFKGGEAVFDLSRMRMLDSILVDFPAAVAAWGTGKPVSVDISLSVDGVNFGAPQTFVPTGGDAVNQWINQRLVAELGGATAQFVKIGFAGTAEWNPVDEVRFVQIVPEPGTLALLLLAAVFGMMFRGRGR